MTTDDSAVSVYIVGGHDNTMTASVDAEADGFLFLAAATGLVVIV